MFAQMPRRLFLAMTMLVACFFSNGETIAQDAAVKTPAANSRITQSTKTEPAKAEPIKSDSSQQSKKPSTDQWNQWRGPNRDGTIEDLK